MAAPAARLQPGRWERSHVTEREDVEDALDTAIERARSAEERFLDTPAPEERAEVALDVEQRAEDVEELATDARSLSTDSPG